MKPLVILFGCALVASVMPVAAQPPMSTEPAPGPQLSSNEQAGLPNLDTINGTATQRASANATVEFNAPRRPSFYHKEANGTVIEEYRYRGRPTQINVHSDFGTHYQLSAPVDASPKVQNQDMSNGRLPSINIPY